MDYMEPLSSPGGLDEDDSSASDCELPRTSSLPRRPKTIFDVRPKRTDFHRSTNTCLQLIRDAILHHRWQEAAEYMAHCTQLLIDDKCTPEGNEVIWRMAIEILHHHPNTKMSDYSTVYESMKHLGVRHYLTLSLEHAFHLMVHGQIEEARQQLSVAERWRYGEESRRQAQKKTLIQAYRGLMDYLLWRNKKAQISNSDDTDSDRRDLESYYKQACGGLQAILKVPGVWDPFILSYVELLEYHGEHEEVLKVLKSYANDPANPPNPNALVYLYEYLKRCGASDKKLSKVLTRLHSLVPSHELMPELCSLLLRSDKPKGPQAALAVALDLLDYACWGRSLDVWNALKMAVVRLKLQPDWQAVVREAMAARAGWWAELHFTSLHASRDAEENPELLRVKASLQEVLCPGQGLSYVSGQARDSGEVEEDAEETPRKRQRPCEAKRRRPRKSTAPEKIPASPRSPNLSGDHPKKT